MVKFSKGDRVYVHGQVGYVYHNYYATIIEDNTNIVDKNDLIKVQLDDSSISYPYRHMVEKTLDNN